LERRHRKQTEKNITANTATIAAEISSTYSLLKLSWFNWVTAASVGQKLGE
jgi:hypothetical protein